MPSNLTLPTTPVDDATWASIVAAITRREILIGGAALAALTAIGACSGDAPAGPDSTGTAGAQVAHRYGTTVVPSRPQRVVTIGLVDHDAVLALDMVPVAVTANAYSAEQPYGVWPWAQDRLGEARPEVLDADEINFERIAALDPDLILAVYAGITDEDYTTLSAIAPTVAQPAGHADYQAPWGVMTRLIARALGQESRAEELIAEVDTAFAEARAQHPEFAGKVAAYAGVLGAGEYYAETEGSARVGILTSLGFVAPADLASDDFFVEISAERLDLLDRDVLVWELGSPESRVAIESDPVYQQLDVAAEGRAVFVVDPEVAGAMALISALSLPLVIDRLVPQLAAAVDGDPSTPVPSQPS